MDEKQLRRQCVRLLCREYLIDAAPSPMKMPLMMMPVSRAEEIVMNRTFVALALMAFGVVVPADDAHSVIIGGTAVVIQQPQSLPGMVTYDIYVQFTSADDTLINHTQWNCNVIGPGLIHNVDPAGRNDPLGLVPNDGGDVPVPSAIPGYSGWAFDTYLCIDDSVLSQTEPMTHVSSTHISGGAFMLPPFAVAGNDAPAGGSLMGPHSGHLIQIAQITMTAGTLYAGTVVVVTPSAVAGQGVDTTTLIIAPLLIPGPSPMLALAGAGMLGLRIRCRPFHAGA